MAREFLRNDEITLGGSGIRGAPKKGRKECGREMGRIAASEY